MGDIPREIDEIQAVVQKLRRTVEAIIVEPRHQNDAADLRKDAECLRKFMREQYQPQDDSCCFPAEIRKLLKINAQKLADKVLTHSAPKLCNITEAEDQMTALAEL